MYTLGNVDVGSVVVSTAFEVFAAPLLIGSILLLCGCRVGFRLLRAGSLLFFLEPGTLVALWKLRDDPEFNAYLTGSGNQYGRKTGGSDRTWTTSGTGRLSGELETRADRIGPE
jgi:hypothetical protein